MFESFKERKRQQELEYEYQLQQEKARLLAMPEKELLVEIYFELKRIDRRIDHVERMVRVYGN